MKWRCTWCGKPHESNDPPCDECGHNKFEEAVVRTGDEPEPKTVDTGTTYVWRCESCGRDHVKNNPPCSRCHHHDLKKVEQTYDDVERDLETPGWLEVARPYLPVFVVVGLVFALFATGIVSPSIIPGIGSPSPPDAPGEGSEVAGLDLETVEPEVHAQLEAERDESRTYDERLAAFAEYQNRVNVIVEHDDGQPDPVSPDEFGVECDGDLVGGPFVFEIDPTAYDDEADLAGDVATELLEATGDELRTGHSSEGLDLHVTPDGTIAVFYVAC
ncbi:hypothetical protein [Natrarchaeobaculum sulfurireducens]|uniref:Zn ribbon containing protein n=1 Tax=Natrarchaeobaculum sulfurireducens TaxID=2044521 RepID=A0A346PQU4_9EURY|nr:hypothetical protein [Natrarchaeobaculum sulfurireducens]AXR78122.1 Zn ribbon containing protein [Natrarchaeobaculum sulfurireducens]AXR81889.1 hypothetical protein AArcMg_1882 [Natrarchaeobaculum sulfurireducens]